MSKSVIKWAEFRTSVAPRLASLFFNASWPRHSPIGEPLSLALENVTILWWATPPENWRARQWLTSNRSPQSAGPWRFQEPQLRNCIVVDILWWAAPEIVTIRNYCRSIIFLTRWLLKMSCNHSLTPFSLLFQCMLQQNQHCAHSIFQVLAWEFKLPVGKVT